MCPRRRVRDRGRFAASRVNAPPGPRLTGRHVQRTPAVAKNAADRGHCAPPACSLDQFRRAAARLGGGRGAAAAGVVSSGISPTTLGARSVPLRMPPRTNVTWRTPSSASAWGVDVDLVTLTGLERVDVVGAGRPDRARQDAPVGEAQLELVAVDPHRLLRGVHDVRLDDEAILRHVLAPHHDVGPFGSDAGAADNKRRSVQPRRARTSPGGEEVSDHRGRFRRAVVTRPAPAGRARATVTGRGYLAHEAGSRYALRRQGPSAVQRLQQVCSRAQSNQEPRLVYAEVVFHVAVR